MQPFIVSEKTSKENFIVLDRTRNENYLIANIKTKEFIFVTTNTLKDKYFYRTLAKTTYKNNGGISNDEQTRK